MEDDDESGVSAAVALSMEAWALEKDRLQALSLDVALEEEEIEQALRLSSLTDGFSESSLEEVGGDDLDQAMSLSALQEQMRVKSQDQLDEEIAEAIARSLGLNERESEEEDEICLICHTEALSALPSIVLTCGHEFHKECCR